MTGKETRRCIALLAVLWSGCTQDSQGTDDPVESSPQSADGTGGTSNDSQDAPPEDGVAWTEPIGQFDESFDGDGIVDLAGYTAGGVAVQDNGKILIACRRTDGANYRAAVVRLRPDGVEDFEFGTGEVPATAMGPVGTAAGIALQPDGKIVAVGSGAWPGFMVMRLKPDGHLDESFGNGGVASADWPDPSYHVSMNRVAIDAEGRIVVGGSVWTPPNAVTTRAMVAARFKPDGALDLEFGSGGLWQGLTVDNWVRSLHVSLALAPDGSVLLAGGFYLGGSLQLSKLQRYDPATGQSQLAPAIMNVLFEIRGMVLQADAKILVVGWKYGPPSGGLNGRSIVVERYNPDLTPDTTFNGSGLVLADIGWGMGRAVAVQANGKILIAERDNNGCGVLRYHSDGTPDATWGAGGLVKIPSLTEVSGLACQEDGRILVVGSIPENGPVRLVRLK